MTQEEKRQYISHTLQYACAELHDNFRILGNAYMGCFCYVKDGGFDGFKNRDRVVEYFFGGLK